MNIYPRADCYPVGQIHQLLIGYGYASVGPVDGFVYLWITISDAMNTQVTPETSALGRRIAAINVISEKPILLCVDTLILESPLGVFEIGVVEGHKQLKTLTVSDFGDGKLA